MSAFPLEADACSCPGDVSFVPGAGGASQSSARPCTFTLNQSAALDAQLDGLVAEHVRDPCHVVVAERLDLEHEARPVG